MVLLSLNAILLVYIATKDDNKDLRRIVVQRPEKPSEPIVPREDPKTEPEPEPKEVVPEFTEVPTFRNYPGGSVYADVLSHSKDSPFGNGHGRATNVHETAHGIHSYLRMQHSRGGTKINGFYVLDGRAVIIEEPNMRKSRVAEFVPQNLRSYRYPTYITGQRAWDDTPLYIYDEWSAYVLGGMTNVDDVKNGVYKGGWTDGVSGCIGFSIYAVATCMAIEKYDPNYWENNRQFRNFTIWQLKRARDTFMEGHVMEQFKQEKQDILLKNLRESPAAESMRNFIQEHLEGVWLEEGLNVTDLSYQEHQRVLLSPEDDKTRRIQP
jgi:hypothetical protein